MNLIFCLILTLAALSPAPEITGMIADDHGKVASGISLSLISLPSDQVMEKTLSSSDGSFSFAGLASGNYGLEAKTESACAFSDAIQVHHGFTSIVHLRLVTGFCQKPIVLESPSNQASAIRQARAA
ncbi:MAG: carboxypeptidase-like regulatory domain-containing protein [Candidatus Tumulicola sp.]